MLVVFTASIVIGKQECVKAGVGILPHGFSKIGGVILKNRKVLEGFGYLAMGGGNGIKDRNVDVGFGVKLIFGKDIERK